MFADQMIRNCENDRYAHSIRNANSNLPRSWKWCVVITRLSGATCDSITSTQMPNANADRPWPPM